MAETDYGLIYDETEMLGDLSYLGEEMLPELWRNSALTCGWMYLPTTGVENSSVSDIAVYVYENSATAGGEKRDGVSLTLLLRGTEDGAYTLSETDWCVYTLLDAARGSAQELSDVVRDAVSPYMAQRAWSGEDMTMSATALSQAVDAMAESVEDYLQAGASPDVTGGDAEAQTPEQTGADMNYISDLSDQLSFEEWAELEARASDISQRHNCGVYVAFVDDFTEYGGGTMFTTIYQLYHANELGMGENRTALSSC